MKIFIFLMSAYAVLCKSPEEGDYIEGDMEFDPAQMEAYFEQMENGGNAFAAIKFNLWKTNKKAEIIPYYISSAHSSKSDVIKAAISRFEETTCLRFQEMTKVPSVPHLFFASGTGCSSPIGKRNTRNTIKLAPACVTRGIVIHEIMHSLGFFHEQSRPDRSDYVRIFFKNMNNDNSGNFMKLKTTQVSSRGSPYDFDSIMHYGGKYFSNNGEYTIVTRDPANQSRIGQRYDLSTQDIAQLNTIYKC